MRVTELILRSFIHTAPLFRRQQVEKETLIHANAKRYYGYVHFISKLSIFKIELLHHCPLTAASYLLMLESAENPPLALESNVDHFHCQSVKGAEA